MGPHRRLFHLAKLKPDSTEHRNALYGYPEQGQITERFTRDIEQLGETGKEGKPKLELRDSVVFMR